jgi:tetratricopeptide (TPR) repeat protein
MTTWLLITLLAISQVNAEPARRDFELGNYKAAVSTLKDALTRTPADASLHYLLGRSYLELHNYDDAVTEAEAAVKLAPDNAEYNRWLGRAYGAKAEQSRSFFLARKVKKAFQEAVRLAPGYIAARRDLLQYCVEAPWIVGGDKGEARKQVDAITAIDPLQGRLARAAYLSADKQWKQAESDYLYVLDQRISQIDPYLEAAEFFVDRKDPKNLDRALDAAAHVNSRDSRLPYYRGVSMILHNTDLASAAQLLKSYISSVPEKSDYPSHQSALDWLRKIGG